MNEAALKRKVTHKTCNSGSDRRHTIHSADVEISCCIDHISNTLTELGKVGTNRRHRHIAKIEFLTKSSEETHLVHLTDLFHDLCHVA